MKEQSPIIDRSYIHTSDNIYFCINGNLHSKEAVFGMPYYFSTRNLENIMDIQINEYILIGGEKYSKLLSQIPRESYKDFVKENYPDYMYSPPMWEILMKVDRHKILKTINPRQMVDRVMRQSLGEAAEENPLLYTLHQVQLYNPSLFANVGIGGSTLLKDDFLSVENDLDLIFYKRSSVAMAKEFSDKMTATNPRFTKLEGNVLESYLETTSGQLGGTRESLYHLTKGRWDLLYVDGKKLDFSFVEPSFSPPVASYEGTISTKPVKVKAKITDASDSYFMPTVLDIDNDNFQKVVITKRGYICLFYLDQTVEIVGTEFRNEKNNSRFLLVDDFNGGNISLS